MRNLTQSTYERIVATLRDTSDKPARPLSTVDARDLLEAFEGALELLDEAQNAGIDHATVQRQAEEFLYLDNGDPRIELDEEEPTMRSILLSDLPLANSAFDWRQRPLKKVP
jgi:hypothetical protein